MNENTDMWEALEAAMKDTTVKERYFLTPAALDAATDRGEGGGKKIKISQERELLGGRRLWRLWKLWRITSRKGQTQWWEIQEKRNQRKRSEDQNTGWQRHLLCLE